MSGTLRVLPLGGVGEIGKNMTVVEYDGRIVVVDCGLRFPTADMMGIDLVLPDFTYLRALELGCNGLISVAAHVAGPEMRRMFDEPEQRAEIDASLQDVYSTLFCTASPIPVKAALNMLGHDVGGLRLPLVEASDEERALVQAMLERHGLLSGVHTG